MHSRTCVTSTVGYARWWCWLSTAHVALLLLATAAVEHHSPWPHTGWTFEHKHAALVHALHRWYAPCIITSHMHGTQKRTCGSNKVSRSPSRTWLLPCLDPQMDASSTRERCCRRVSWRRAAAHPDPPNGPDDTQHKWCPANNWKERATHSASIAEHGQGRPVSTPATKSHGCPQTHNTHAKAAKGYC